MLQKQCFILRNHIDFSFVTEMVISKLRRKPYLFLA